MNFKNRIRNYLLEEEFTFTVYKNKINLVNYKDIIDFSDTLITIKHDDGYILIKGKKLIVSKLLNQEMLVEGNINLIELRW